MAKRLTQLYPWLRSPIIASAPMLGAATPSLAANVTNAGGIGFIAGGTNLESLNKNLEETASLLRNHSGALPIGVGFQLWGCKLDVAVAAITKHKPAIAWLFAPKEFEELGRWSSALREAGNGQTHIWIQIGSVAEAKKAVQLADPDVLVVQGSDAGGHGLADSASIISLIPEVQNLLASMGKTTPVLAAGGITDGRGVAGALALGAAGVAMGTRFLAAKEAGIAKGWQQEVLRVDDGGRTTNRSTLCDRLKETKGWPESYNGRAVANQGHVDEEKGMSDQENVAKYKEELKHGDAAWGEHGRMVAYAGTGVGLIHEVKSAAEIVDEVRNDAKDAVKRVFDTHDIAGDSKL